jgi:hypothetical protein
MKKALVCLAGAAALLPGAVSANYFTDEADITFNAGASGKQTLNFTWLDPVFKNLKNGNDKDLDGSYSWVLTDLTSGKVRNNSFGDGVTGDKNNVVSGNFSKTFDNLVDGHSYQFKFLGEWSGEPTGKNWQQIHKGDVNVTPAVPEPETYAMMLAGLGLIGTIARRRNAKR